MLICKTIPGHYSRTVGDPVDVVTGANLDVNRDFELFGPLPLPWRRYYDSSKYKVPGALGWGHTHEYDRQLHLDVDGIRYVAPVGQTTHFPPIGNEGDRYAHDGVVLHCVSSRTYQIRERGNPVFEFYFQDFQSPGRLVRAFQNRDAIRFTYSSNEQLERIIDSLGRTIRVDNDPFGRILRLTLLTAWSKATRVLLTCRYDEAGNLVEFIDAYNHPCRFRWDADRRMITYSDRRGYSFHYAYDQDGRCIHSKGEDGLHEVSLRYLSLERVTVVTRADGGQWTYFYNEKQALTQVIDPYGGVVRYNFDDQGRLAEEVDPNGNVSRMVYDAVGGLMGKLSPLGHFSGALAGPQAARPPAHRVASCPFEWEYGNLLLWPYITPPASDDPVLHLLPDFAARSVQTDSPTELALAAGDPLRKSSAAGRHITAEGRVYDDFGLLLSEAVRGGTRHWTYDANGNTARYHDADGSTYKYGYKSWNQLTRVIDPLGNSVSYDYTLGGQTAAVTDPGGTVHEYAYDHKDRLTQVRRHGVVKEEYRYDEADNFIEKRNGKGATLLSFVVGPGNLKKVRRLASGENHYFDYDARGQLVRAATDDTEVCFAYDPHRNPVLESRDGRGVKHRYAGHRRAETTAFDAFTIRYRPDLADGLAIQDPSGMEHQIRTFEHGLVVRTLGNGSVEVSQFDGQGRCLLKQSSQPRRGGRPWRRCYTYSATGDLLKAEDSAHGTSHYTYDAAHRLVAARLPDGGEQLFVYDAAGNLVQQPGLERVEMRDGNRLAFANGERFEYNDRNNVVVREGRGGQIRYQYDARDMLTRCETAAGAWHAKYDPLGRRMSKAFGTNHVEYFWDRDRLAAEVDGEGRVRIYVYADALALVPMLFLDYDSPQADPASGRRYYLYSDQIGAPIRVEDDRGKTVWSARLVPYGTAHVDPSSQIEMPLRFPGHYFDTETGLHYNRFRYYSPTLGRYLQSDPLGIGGGLNLYAYPASPLTQVDVRGLTCPKHPDNPDPKKCPDCAHDAMEADQELAAHGAGSGTIPNAEHEARAAAAATMGSLEEGERPPTATSAAVDKETGAVFIGQSGKNEEPANQAMRDRVAAAEGREPDWSPTNCAEYDAVNQAAAAGVPPERLTVHTVNTVDGSAKPRCNCCTVTTAGTRTTSG